MDRFAFFEWLINKKFVLPKGEWKVPLLKYTMSGGSLEELTVKYSVEEPYLETVDKLLYGLTNHRKVNTIALNRRAGSTIWQVLLAHYLYVELKKTVSYITVNMESIRHIHDVQKMLFGKATLPTTSLQNDFLEVLRDITFDYIFIENGSYTLNSGELERTVDHLKRQLSDDGKIIISDSIEIYPR